MADGVASFFDVRARGMEARAATRAAHRRPSAPPLPRCRHGAQFSLTRPYAAVTQSQVIFDPESSSSAVPLLSGLALECLLNVAATVGRVVDAADAAQAGPGGLARAQLNEATVLVDAVWEPLLEAFGAALLSAHGENVIVRVLGGHEVFTQACGLIGAKQQRDAFLSTLCKFTLQAPQAPAGPAGRHQGGGGGGGGIAAALPRALTMRLESSVGASSAGGGPERDSRGGALGGGGGGSAQANGGASSSDGASKILSSKNLHALRTLFNCASRLASTLGPSWQLVLETLAALEKVLASPRTTVAEGSMSASATNSGGSAEMSVLAVASQQLFGCAADLADGPLTDLLNAIRCGQTKSIFCRPALRARCRRTCGRLLCT